MASIRDVAKEAGVSNGTVSRAFNGYQDINEETKKKIFEVAKRLGYAPNINAKSLSLKQTKNIGFVISGFLDSDRRNDFTILQLKGIYRYASEHGLEVALYTLNEEQQKKKTYEQFCSEHSLSGVVLAGVATTDPYFTELVDSKIPCVTIDTYIKGKGLGCVMVDNVQAAGDLADYLFAAGHRKIIVMEGSKYAEVNNYRIAGVYAAFEKHGMQLTREQIRTCDFGETIAYEETMKYLQKYGKTEATAFLCFSDIMALGVMQAITDMGYSVPDDFSVVGFDGIPITAYTAPSLTTIEQDMEQIGYQAARLLHEITQNPEESKCEYVPYRFVERRSVKKIAESGR